MARAARPSTLATLALCLGGAAACTTSGKSPEPAPSNKAPSPNASILPAPLTSSRRLDAGADAAIDAALTDGGAALADAAVPPPTPLREDVPVEADGLLERDARTGLRLEARFSWPGLGPAPSGDADPKAIERVAAATDRRVSIALSPAGRMRFVLAGPAFAVESGVELRSRSDLYGHVVVWPDQRSYRVLQPGSLRAFFDEGRADVLAMDPASFEALPPGSAFGHRTQVEQLTTELGQITLAQAEVPGAAGSGALLCRLLVALACVEPTTPACGPDRVPVRAEFSWAEGGKLSFVVTELVEHAELDFATLRVPPAAPHFKADLLPQAASGPLVGGGDLHALRRHDAPVDPGDAGIAPATGLTLINRDDVLSYALLDGLPVARVAPGHSVLLEGLRPGSYTLRWVDFLGTTPTDPESVAVPGRRAHGAAADAGEGSPP